MKLYIKHMASIHSKMMVKAELDKLGLHYGAVDLGEVEVKENVTDGQHEQLKVALLKSGLELQADNRAALIKKVKTVILEMLNNAHDTPRVKFSDYLADKLNYDYTYLSNIFSEVTGVTIERFIITEKIELVKELLLADKDNLTQISYKLNYSSVAHLSGQFKKITGLTPSVFKKMKFRKINSVGTAN